jgi:hypothetical protein
MIKLSKSPISTKKFRVVFKDGIVIDFGARGYSDYTIHKNPLRMRRYVGRHGGKLPKYLKNEKDPKVVHQKMLEITKSYKEDWSKRGIKTAGFWSRWLLWSFPTLREAKKFMKKKFRLHIV